MSLQASYISDEENIDPHARPKDTLPNNHRSMEPAQASTPRQAMSDIPYAQKRRRVNGAEDDHGIVREGRSTRYYDPEQDPDVRREVKKESRLLERDFYGKRCRA